ncbi:nuclear pore complex protein NUP1 [Quercus robur]|uniref:nuclear pore complex protein NUP1 n=1 Tax=Quercus robur TaxID=38942 RepID=UPI0021619352|nr:nuclear pore complex protein NUP1 [Quercus robur]
METAREEKPYAAVSSEGGFGTGGKFRKRPFRRATQTTPYDRPRTAIRTPSLAAAVATNNNGWLSRLVDPAQRLIASSAHRLFSAFFSKRLAPPPPPQPPQPSNSEANQELNDKHPEVRDEYHEAVDIDSPGVQRGAIDRVDKSSSSSDKGGLTELEQILKQKTFTRSEIDRLTALLHARTLDINIGDEEKKSEVIPSEPVGSNVGREELSKAQALENGIGSHLISTPVINSSVLDEDVASPAELAKAYMGSKPSKVSPSMLGIRSQALREDSSVISSGPFLQKSPIMPLVLRSSGHVGYPENGFMTPRSRGKSAIYSMARTPYSRVNPTSTIKGVGPIVAYDGPSSSSSQAAWEQNKVSGSKQGALKRRSSVLDNDIGSVGPIRRIRQKPSLLSSRGLSVPVSGSPLPIAGTGVSPGSAQRPSFLTQKSPLRVESKDHLMKNSTENGDNSIPGTSFPLVSSKSSEMASKILQQLEKLVSPKEKSSEFKLASVRDSSPSKLSPSMLRGKALRSLETVESPKLLENLSENNKLDSSLDTLLPDAVDITQQKQNKVEENGPLKLVSSSDISVSVVNGVDSKAPNKDTLPSIKFADSVVINSFNYPPQKRRPFRMTAQEDFLELDDDYSNGAAPTSLVEEREKDDVVAERKSNFAEVVTQEKPPSLSGFKPPESAALNQKTDVTSDGPVVTEKSIGFAFPKANSTSEAVPPAMISIQSSLKYDKSASPKQPNVSPPTYSFGDKVASPKEPNAASAVASFFTASSADKKMPQFTLASSSLGSESAGHKFGVSSDPKPESSSSFSTFVAGATDSMPKVPELEKADNKNNSNAGVTFRTPETAFSSAASTSTPTASIGVNTTANNSFLNNGSLSSSPSFPSTIPPLLFNNVPIQNSSNSSMITLTSTGSSSSTTTTSAFATSITSSTSLSTSAASGPIFKFGPTVVEAPVTATSGIASEAAKTRPESRIGNFGGNLFVGTSATNASTGSSIFGFSAAATSSAANSQSQGSTLFSAGSGSALSAQASPAGTGVAAFTNSIPIQFSSSAPSPSFGLAGNTALSSGSSSFAVSTPAAKPFNSGAAFGLGTSASSADANSNNAIGSTTSSLFGSWQPSKSPIFGSSSTFNSSSSSIGSSVAASTASVAATTSPSTGFSFPVSSTTSVPTTTSPFAASTSSVAASTTSSTGFPFVASGASPSTGFPFAASTASAAAPSSAPVAFGSSIVASSGPTFSFTSAMATPTSQPVFGNPNPFTINPSSSGNNDQMNMEDSMAEDTIQASMPTVPVFGQAPVTPPQSGFVFGSTPSAGNPFQFGAPQNSATPQNQSPFQASNSLGGSSFSLGAGGGDKANRKIVRVSRNKTRRK